MSDSKTFRLWTQRPSWKQRNREFQYHSHPSDNFCEDGEIEKDIEKSTAARFRRRHRSEQTAATCIDGNPSASPKPFIENDRHEEDGTVGDDFDVNQLIPPIKFNVLHHRHTATNGDRWLLPLQQPTLTIQNCKQDSNEKQYARGPILTSKRNLARNLGCLPSPKGNGWIRYLFLLGICLYFFVMIIQSRLLYQQWKKSGVFAPSLMFMPGFFNKKSNRNRVTLSVHDMARMAEEISTRNRDRRLRTSPPQLSPSYSIDNYEILSFKDEEEPFDRSIHAEAQRPANFEELCGIHAQQSALSKPYSFLSRDALNADARVLITGILNPIGFHLALALKERCGVESIIGIDPMFPNTVENRLHLQERIKILTANIPQLVQPITLPFIGLDARLKKRDSLSSILLLNSTGELNLLHSQPTHIIHLASYAPDVYSGESMKRDWRNTYSPYVSIDYNPPMYKMQSSAVAMEQILASIASTDTTQRPHFTYSSLTQQIQDPYDHFFACSKQMDDILVDTYHSLFGTFATGLRLPNAVYGPWARPGNVVHDIADSLAGNWNSSTGNQKHIDAMRMKQQLDLLYVDDVVDAIIATMQFRSESSSPVAFEVTSGETVATELVELMALSLVQPHRDYAPLSKKSEVIPFGLHIQDYIRWKPQTSMRSGLLRTIAWHLDRHHPFGRSTLNSTFATSGDEFLTMHGAPSCAADDILCHAGDSYLPCISECRNKANCTLSVFDDVVGMVQDVSVGCDIVMYTQSLGRDVEDLKLHVQYVEDSTPQICNLAFVPRESRLVESVVHKVPYDQLVKFGVAPPAGEVGSGNVTQDRKLDGLNGNLLYRGWILIWIRDAMSPLSPSDEALLKIAPGRFFSPDVKSAVFVDQHFSVSPTFEDITFLFDELHREPLRQRSTYQTVASGGAKIKVKYRLPAEPARNAMMLLSMLKVPQDPGEPQPMYKKISLYDASRLMRFEVGIDPDAKESPELQRQREFYERIPSFVNQHDLRSTLEPIYYYEMKHWIRSRWIVHNLRFEESRQLRCEWYQEQVLWGADLDQLSFAHVMARTELKRRLAHHEPDDRSKSVTVEHPELLSLSDAHEWHALITGGNHMLDMQVKKIPDHLADIDSGDNGDEAVTAAQPSNEVLLVGETPILAVRIMSEKMIATFRAIWSRKKGQKPQPKR